jgi:hypothetical protein
MTVWFTPERLEDSGRRSPKKRLRRVTKSLLPLATQTR